MNSVMIFRWLTFETHYDHDTYSGNYIILQFEPEIP